MDDIITGTDDVASAIEVRTQLHDMLFRGGFRLRKWASNAPDALKGVLEEDLAISQEQRIGDDFDSMIKTLGLTWLPSSDLLRFQFHFTPLEPGGELTKRKVLSQIAKLFDPLGLLGAVITTAKIIMQHLWLLRDAKGNVLDWDQPLPSTVGEKWKNYHNQLQFLNQVQVNRCVIIPQAVSMEIHCFSDASEKAYGGCVYVRSKNADGTINVRLLSSRSRVSPLRCQSIPRLELCGALIVAQLFEKIHHSTKMTVSTTFWTDSTCVLRWVQATPATWTTFVANRVAKIQNLTEGCHWKYISGTNNPADLISRGIDPHDIIENKLWWEGPNWLSKSCEDWPIHDFTLSNEGIEEKRRSSKFAAPAANTINFAEDYISKCSCYSELLRRIAYWLRLIKLLGTRVNERPKFKFLTTIELENAENV